MQGVLGSWAVPKGPSYHVADKRFAALVEDHPLEYGEFEGRIPEGNYGAGWTIVWDKGFWRPLTNPIEDLQKGKLLFELHGCKLHGKRTLVRMKAEKDWLFIKEYDDHADETFQTKDFSAGSVFSGLSLKDLDQQVSPATKIQRSLSRTQAAKKQTPSTRPMLASRSEPSNRPGWLYEIKYDGYRLICSKEKGVTKLTSRNGKDLTQTFPEIALAITRLPYDDLILDGEVVVLDLNGLPNFANMQKRGRLSDPSAIRDAMRRFPVTLCAFDLIAFADYDLTDLPLKKRKEHLLNLLPEAGLIRFLRILKKTVLPCSRPLSS